MATVKRCDRCGHDEIDTVANRELPNGWERVCGVDLCNKCSRELHKWLEPIPKTIAYVREDV
jgi:hypothetical protein